MIVLETYRIREHTKYASKELVGTQYFLDYEIGKAEYMKDELNKCYSNPNKKHTCEDYEFVVRKLD